MAEGEGAPKPDFQEWIPGAGPSRWWKNNTKDARSRYLRDSGHFQKFLSVLLASFAKFSAESGSCHDGWVGRYRVTEVS